jgi:NADH-quinone oxidoreductase subunit C
LIEMEEVKDDLRQALQEKMGEKIELITDAYYPAVQVNASNLLELMGILKEEYGFNHLANLSSVDYGEEFEVVYHIHSFFKTDKILVKTRVPRNRPEVASVFSIWPTADWQEREVYDLMGIKFKGHPNLIRVLLPDDFEGHPLRKDFRMEVK